MNPFARGSQARLRAAADLDPIPGAANCTDLDTAPGSRQLATQTGDEDLCHVR
jgi:hypothetical protein